MEDSDEPPTAVKVSYTHRKTHIREKRRLIGPEYKKTQPPRGLKIHKSFERTGLLNPAVIQHRNDPSRLTFFPRLTYHDGTDPDTGKPMEYSCITKLEGKIIDGQVIIHTDEELIFHSQGFKEQERKHTTRGIEDFRAMRVNGERVHHGFAVSFDGFNARTFYTRTDVPNPEDITRWNTNFGYWFPNIHAQEAIDLVEIERYKKEWEAAYGQQTVKDAKAENPKKQFPEEIYLGSKDCLIFPNKVRKDIGEGPREYYAIPIRLLPDIQVVYLTGFNDLADRNLSRRVIKNLRNHIMMEREFWWEESHIGISSAPVRIPDEKTQGLPKKLIQKIPEEYRGQYLMGYHGAVMNGGRVYRGGEVVVDENDPQNILARTEDPVLFPTEDWEIEGNVPGQIVFPTSYVFHDGLIHCFYGAGDKYIGHVAKPLTEILQPFHE